ncbi:MAG: hypothetical protein U0175_26795 [Caldilineaceae bacterium]
MSATTFSSLTDGVAKSKQDPRMLLGGWTVLAESAWMGSVQSSDIL